MRNLILCICCSATAAFGQSPDIAELQNLKPRCIGPAGMSGRVTSIAVARQQPNLIYVGTASGGLWKSDNGGIAWEPVFDKMDVGSIGSIAIQQNNSSIIWAGTGEGNPRNSHNSGKGIYKSLDGGRSWTNMGLEKSKTIHRILIDPQHPETVYAATMGSAWGSNTERGIFKTTDGGKTWQNILFISDKTGCAELVMDPENPNKLFASMWQYERKPYTFTSGGAHSGFYMSIDGGKNWKKLGTADGLPDGDLGRIGIAVSPSKTNVVYAIIESKKLEFFRSDDGGYTWKKVSSSNQMGNRPFYYNEIYVDPKNENRIFSLWSQVSKSEDGGKTWAAFLDWGHIHPDHHAFYVHPDNPDFMIDGNDGGLNISHDGGQNWRYVSNLPVGQFYHVRVDDAIPYNVYGGLQDNGSYKGPGYTWKEGGIRNSDWQEVLFGDGFDVIPVPGNPNKGYASWQGGNLYFYDLISHQNQSIQPVHPQGKPLRFNWNAAMAIQPGLANSIYCGSQYVHYSTDNGKSWTIISPDLTTNDTSKLHQAKSGGLTIDATNAENYCTIISIVPAVSDNQVIWVGTDDGNLQLTKDGGKTWTLLTPNILGAPKNAWIPFIQVSKTNAGEAWVVMNNYRQNDWEPYLFRTTDYGKTWKRMADGNRVKGHCLSVHQDLKEPKLVFLGTDFGLWISIDGGNTWKQWTYGMPSCPVQDFAYQEREDDLVIATFGRSIYILDHLEAFRKLAVNAVGKNKINIVSAENTVAAKYIRPTGERYGADGFFQGANKAYGAPIIYKVNANKNVKTGKWEKAKLNVHIYNDSGKLIRKEKINNDSTGIYTMQWHLQTDGFRMPSYHSPTEDATLPPGLTAKPGKYKIVFILGNDSDAVYVTINENPTQPVNAAALAKTEMLYAQIKIISARATKAFDALKESEKTIEQIKTLQFEDDSASARLTALAKPIIDSINALKYLYMVPSDFTAYDDVTPFLNEKLQAALGYILNNEPPGENALNAIANAKKETDKIVERINAFYTKQWAAFKLKVDAEKVKVIKIQGNY